MSLRNQPEFEAMESETAATVETTTKEETMNTTTDTASASVQATTAIATAAASSALSTVTTPTKFKVAFADKCGIFDTDTVEGMSLAVPRAKAEQGSIFISDQDQGSIIQFELISFNYRWAIGTGEQDKEAAQFFRVSFDNKTISGTGESLDAYVESLKAQGFNKTKVSPYLDMFGFVTWSEKNGTVPVEERQLVCVQCSQTSLGAFKAFSATRGLLESKGVVQPLDVIEIHAEKRTSGSNKFTNYSFHAPKSK